jgi:hypothetical protein
VESPDPMTSRGLFERFTDRARRVIVLGQEEARRLNHNYIGTEHILLGLVREGEGVAAMAVNGLGIYLEGVRQQVEEIIGVGQQAPSGHIPFTPRAKVVLQLSLREALQLGHEYIGTEHILLALVREGEGVGAQVLIRLGADLNRVRQQVIVLLSGYPSVDEPTAVTPAQRAAPTADPVASGSFDAQIAKLRQDKESAIDSQDFERAARLRDQEKSLLRAKAQAEREHPKSGHANRVFICYRREDSAWVAGRVHDELVRQLGTGMVFMDVDSIEPGRDFVEATMAAMSSCDFVLVLIGPRWLQVTTDSGIRRLDAPDDYVRTELEAALALGKRIIPLLVEGAMMPRPDQLPGSVTDLARRHAIRIEHGGFHEYMSNLLHVINSQ